MGKCIECYYSTIVNGNRLACQGQKYMPIVGANWGCEWFKPKSKNKRTLILTEDDIKQLIEFSNFINKLIHNLDE